MKISCRALLFVLVISSALTSLPLSAQSLIDTVTVGYAPYAIAHNPATNQIYVANDCGDDPNCASYGTVTVIDGATDATTTVDVYAYPVDIKVNPATNQIYDVEQCGGDLTCASQGTVTVIDGPTNGTSAFLVGYLPFQASVNSVTNRIYITNECGDDASCNSPGTVTVIYGDTDQTATIDVGYDPGGMAINTATNRIYVANYGDGTVSVIDGYTNNVVDTITVGFEPAEVAVNELTNQIYVTNYGDDTVTVINGGTDQTTTVGVDVQPYSVAVNQVTNQAYVADSGSNTVTVIDGATLGATLVTVGNGPAGVAVGPVTNDIYVPNFYDATMTDIYGVDNSTTTVDVGNSPDAVDVNVVTNLIYVANYDDGTVSVLAGFTTSPVQFVAVPPCRLVDTRQTGGAIPGGAMRYFPIPNLGGCNIPASATVYSLNVTVVPSGRLGFLTIWPTGEDQPTVSTMNSLDGRIKANAAIVPAGYQDNVSVYVSNTTNVILDIDGYFTAANEFSLQFYPLTPCRVVDTRSTNGPLGGPFLQGNTERSFPVLDSTCFPSGINPAAYSFNVSVVPNPSGQRLGYLSIYPAGQSQPVVSTLNNPTATIVANAAIVPAGSNGDVTVFPNGTTDMFIDVNGYFDVPSTQGLSLYPVAPCRVLDTRLVGSGQPIQGEYTVDVDNSPCLPSQSALAYVFNATVVPPGYFGYLSLWPDGEDQPVVSTLNAIDGAITSNMAIVPTNNGLIDAYASALTQLILDISSYFAPEPVNHLARQVRPVHRHPAKR